MTGVVVAGEGAIARKHLAAVARIQDVQVLSLAGGNPEDTRSLASEMAIPHWSVDLAESLRQPGIDAAILATPTPLHAAQAIETLQAGVHVLVEIPMADNLDDAERLAMVAGESDLVAMVCHTRRFNPSHQWVNEQIARGELRLLHLVVQTFFLRRENTNALGQPRTWTDHLLWHHACHTVDLFQYQTEEDAALVAASAGPTHPDLGIAMDMSVTMTAPTGAVCSLALSFNNDGPLGTSFRYICDKGTYVARYDELVDGWDQPVDLSGVTPYSDGIEIQDREFFDAIRDHREPNASVRQCLSAMRTIDRIAHTL